MPFGFVPPPTPPASGATPPFSGGDVVGGYFIDSNTEIRDDGDPTRLIRFELGGTTGTVVLTPPATAGTYALAVGSSWDPTAAEVITNKDMSDPSNDITGATATSLTNGSGATITLPLGAGDRTLATLDGTETLENKTLTDPVIAALTSGAVSQTVPSTTAGELINTTQAQTFTAATKTFEDFTLALQGSNVGLSYVLGGNQPVDRNFTLPQVSVANSTFVLESHTQTLSNKTLTAPVIASIVNGVTQTIPSGNAGELVNTTQAQTLLTGAKTFRDGILRLRNPADSFSATIHAGAQTLDIDATLPVLAAGDTFVMLGATQQFTAGVKTYNTGLLQLRNPLNSFSVTLNAGAQTANRTYTFPVAATGTIVLDNATQTLTGKTLTSPTISGAALIADSSFFRDDVDNTKRMAFQLSGLPTATTVTYTTPNSNGELVVGNAAQTLTNKTLVAPIIDKITNAGVDQTIPSGTAGTLVNTTLAQTFITGVKTFNDGFLALRNPADSFSATLRAGAQTGARNFTMPVTAANDTIVTLAATQTLTGKTLTSPVISAITSGASTQTLPTTTGTLLNTVEAALLTTGVKTFGENILALRNPLNTFSAVVNAGAQVANRTFTLPVAASDTIVTAAASQTLTNKTFTDSTTAFADDGDATKLVRFDCSLLTTGTTRTYTWPNISSEILTIDDKSAGATSIGATTRFADIYLTERVDIARAVALSTTYATFAQFHNTTDSRAWVLGVQTTVVGTARLGFRYNNGAATSRGFFSSTGGDTQVNHTMQHHLLLDDPSELTTGVGLLFQRVDGSVSTFLSREPGTILEGPSGIIVDDALPIMRLCPATRNAKGVYGVLCRQAPREWYGGPMGMELDDVPDIAERGLFATQGEGALWVLAPVVDGDVPACYHVELGDFLSSGGFVPGYAGRQMSQADGTIDDADAHFSWSVARAGFSCEYDTSSTAYTCENVALGGVDYRRAFIPVGFCM